MKAPTTKGDLIASFRVELGEWITGLGWSPDGTVLGAVTARGELTLHTATTGATRWRREAHPGGATALAWHPREARCATGGQDGRARLWDTEGNLLAEIGAGTRGWVGALAWSPDGAWLAVSIGKEVLVVAERGAPRFRTEQHASTVSGVAWLPPRKTLGVARDELTLLSAAYGEISTWTLAGSRSARYEWKGSLLGVAPSPDGEIVACGSQDATVHFWRRGNGQDSQMSGYPSKISALAWDAGSRFLATGGGSAVTVWDFAGGGPEGTRPHVLEAHVDTITALGWSGRKRLLASGSRDGGVCLWSLESAPKLRGFALTDSAVECLALRRDDSVLAVGSGCGGLLGFSRR